jgi:hypothetical protein
MGAERVPALRCICGKETENPVKASFFIEIDDLGPLYLLVCRDCAIALQASIAGVLQALARGKGRLVVVGVEIGV